MSTCVLRRSLPLGATSLAVHSPLWQQMKAAAAIPSKRPAPFCGEAAATAARAPGAATATQTDRQPHNKHTNTQTQQKHCACGSVPKHRTTWPVALCFGMAGRGYQREGFISAPHRQLQRNRINNVSLWAWLRSTSARHFNKERCHAATTGAQKRRCGHINNVLFSPSLFVPRRGKQQQQQQQPGAGAVPQHGAGLVNPYTPVHVSTHARTRIRTRTHTASPAGF